MSRQASYPVSHLENDVVEPDPVARRGNRFAHSWTEEIVIERLQQWAESLGQPPSQSHWEPARMRAFVSSARKKALWWSDLMIEYDRGDWPSVDTVYRLFGGWNAALEAAGFTAKPMGRTSNAFKIRHRYRAHVDALTDLEFGMEQLRTAAGGKNITEVRQAIEDMGSMALAWLEHFDKGLPTGEAAAS